MSRTLTLPLLAASLLALVAAPAARAHTIFFEDFDSYSSFPDERPDGDEVNLGVPEQSEGADEPTWLTVQFGEPEIGCDELGLQDDCKVGVQRSGGNDHDSPVGRFEDRAALVFSVDTTNVQNLTLEFDWRTFAAEEDDDLVAAFLVADVASDNFEDWTEIERDGEDSDWRDNVNNVLPAEVENRANVFFAFLLDGNGNDDGVGAGNNDYGKLDNVQVTGDPIPEPSTLALAALAALAGITARRRR